MILYHGSNIEIDHIDLCKCRPYKDFGRGFYLTSLQNQAIEMAKRTAKLMGGNPIVTKFDFDSTDLSSVNVRKFDMHPTIEWARFVINNRNKRFEPINSPECNLDFKYDLVIGPVADDRISTLLVRYINGYIDESMLMKGLTYKKLNDQYSFHTEKAVDLLEKVGVLSE